MEEVAIEQVVDAAESCIGQHAGGNEDEKAMELGLFAPEDGKAETDGEGEHVEERDNQKRVRTGLVEPNGIEASHDDGRGNAQENHDGPDRGAEPAQEAMPAHMMGADQRGLKNEEHNPSGKGGRMDPEGEGASMGREWCAILRMCHPLEHRKIRAYLATARWCA
jgi:hypothetical protein